MAGNPGCQSRQLRRIRCQTISATHLPARNPADVIGPFHRHLLNSLPGQADLKHSSPRRRLHPNRPLVVANDPLHDVGSQSGAFTNRLGGEEWIEDAALYLGRDTRATIADLAWRSGRALSGRSAHALHDLADNAEGLLRRIGGEDAVV